MKVHTCPKCGTTARNESQLEKKFGWRVRRKINKILVAAFEKQQAT